MYKSYGPCELLTSYDIVVDNLNQIFLQSNLNNEISRSKENDEQVDFLQPKSIYEVAADQSSCDTMWFVKISKILHAEHNCKNIYNHSIITNHQQYLEGYHLEQDSKNLSTKSLTSLTQWYISFQSQWSIHQSIIKRVRVVKLPLIRQTLLT